MIEALLRDHLVRLTVWSVVSLTIGLLMAMRRPKDLLAGWVVLTIGWSIVNLIIAIPGLLRPTPQELVPLREFLWLNMGLNVGYLGVAVTLIVMGRERPFARGAGIAVGIQGLALLILDGVLLFQMPHP